MSDSSNSSNSSSVTCVAGDISIRLVPYFQRDYEHLSAAGFRLRVDARDPCGLEQAIFRYIQLPAEVLSGEIKSELSGVCTWPDMESLPIGAPAPSLVPPTFRLDYIDIVVDNSVLAAST